MDPVRGQTSAKRQSRLSVSPNRNLLLNELRGEYQQSSRARKSQILTALCTQLSVHRKYAIRLLSGQDSTGMRSARTREFAETALGELMLLTGDLSLREMSSMMSVWEPVYRRSLGAAQAVDSVHLVHRSPASLSRSLRKLRAPSPLKALYSAVRSVENPFASSYDIRDPGAVSLRSVQLVGEFDGRRTVQRGILLQDAATGWTVIRPVTGNVTEELGAIVDRLPFAVTCIHVEGEPALVEAARSVAWGGDQAVAFSSSVGGEIPSLPLLTGSEEFGIWFNFGMPLCREEGSYRSAYETLATWFQARSEDPQRVSGRLRDRSLELVSAARWLLEMV